MDSSADRAKLLLERMVELRRHLLSGMSDGLPALAALDLTVPQAMVLFRLVEVGPHTITELKQVSGRSQGATSHLVTQLEARGWVQRGTDTADGRRTRVSATAKAKKLVAEVQGLRVRAIRDVLSRVPRSTVDQLDRALSRMLDALRSEA